MAEQGIDEQQLITFSGNPNGGDWLLGFRGEMCAPPLKYNANGPAMTAALCACSTVGEGNLRVVKRASVPEYDVFFSGALGGQDVPLIEVDGSGLNRGSVVVTVVIEGSAPPVGVGSTLRDRLHAALPEDRAQTQALKDSLLANIDAKKTDQSAKGLPPEKSFV